MPAWLRWIFGAAFVAGIVYLTWRVSAQIEFTRFLLQDPEIRRERHMLPIAWIWSSIPVAILWCSVAFYGLTAGTGWRVTRLAVLGVGITAICILIAFILSLMLPVSRV
jgi:hypothetical protein